jgi:hypothetical protein
LPFRGSLTAVAGHRARRQRDGEKLLLDVEQETDLRRTYTMVARLAHQGVSQDHLERVLREVYRDGNDTMRSALLESNEALNALGYGSISYSDLPGD